MKFILFNVNDTKNNVINKIELSKDCYINEVSLSKTRLEERVCENPKFIQRIKNSFLDRDIHKKILKALEGYNKKWYYILSKDICNVKYITCKTEELLGYKTSSTSELDTNIFKYVDEYVKENNSLKKHELKALLVASTNKNLNFTLINNLIKEYKNVNIYLKEKPSTYTLKQIKQINKNEGTTIEVVKKERKVFTEYNIIYFVDDVRENFPRFRLNKDALVLDVGLCMKDKFNSNLMFINEYMTNEGTIKDNINELLKKYNSLELASIVRKIVNDLDKS